MSVIERAKRWMERDPDPKTRDEVAALIEARLIDLVVRQLEFLASKTEIDNAIESIASDTGLSLAELTESVAGYGLTFEDYRLKIKSEIERAKARRRPFTIAGTYAKRFAAKEAFSKAVGTGFRRGVFMKDIGVVNAKSGAPTLSLTGGAAIVLAEMVPEGHEARIHLTLTDDHPWAQAYVIIEALPK